MKNIPKKVMAVILALVAVVILVAVVFLGERDNDRYSGEQPTETHPSVIDPYEKPTESPIPTIDIGSDDIQTPPPPTDNVKITINPAIEDAVIDRTMEVPSNHPEYIESYMGGGTFASEEGKVFKNDRTISIDVQNTQNGEWTTYSFGLSCGTYNRFLYLNPVRHTTNPDVKGYFRFFSRSGLLLDLAPRFDNPKEMQAKYDNFSVRRAMDQLAPANYTDPLYPGTIWYTARTIEMPVSIDVICYQGQGSIAAILKLWIDKDENDCYYIASVEDQNLYLKNDPTFTNEEIHRIYEMVDEDILDDELIGLSITDNDWSAADYIYDFRDPGEGPYYFYFLPYKSATALVSNEYKNERILAVTLYNNGTTQSITLYYMVITMPYDGSPGIYRYLGRDYPYNTAIKELQLMGYPGFD